MKRFHALLAAIISFVATVEGKAAIKTLPAGIQEVKLPWGNDSATGPYLNFYPNNTMLNASREYDAKNTNGMWTIVTNNSTRTHWAEFQLTFAGLGYHGLSLHFPGKENVSKIEIPANSSIKFGNLWEPEIRGAGHEQFTFRLRGYEGCDEMGDNCNGRIDDANIVEWSYDTQPKYRPGLVGINLSNVDGYSMPVALEYGKNSTCTPKYCQVYPEDLEVLCPPSNLWKDNGTVGCISDCRRTGSKEYCCPLPIGPSECAPSNTYLKSMCGASVSYAYDDSKYQECQPDGEMRVYFG